MNNQETAVLILANVVDLDGEDGTCLNCLHGKPVITHLINKIKTCNIVAPSHIVVCCGCDALDMEVSRAVKAQDASVHHYPNRKHVLTRLIEAAEHFKVKRALVVMGDAMFQFPSMFVDLARALGVSSADLIMPPEGHPRNQSAVSLHVEALQRLWAMRQLLNVEENQAAELQPFETMQSYPDAFKVTRIPKAEMPVYADWELKEIVKQQTIINEG